MIDADTIKHTIVELVGDGNTPVTFENVAKKLDLANWEDLMESIRLVAEVMELQGLIKISGDTIQYSGKHDTSENN